MTCVEQINNEMSVLLGSEFCNKEKKCLNIPYSFEILYLSLRQTVELDTLLHSVANIHQHIIFLS